MPRLILLLVFFISACSSDNSESKGELSGGAQSRSEVIDPSIMYSAVNYRELLNVDDEQVSYCESSSQTGSTYSGSRDLEPLPLASLSKLFVSAWSLDQWRPDQQFEFKIRSTKPDAQGGVDLYLDGSFDIYVETEKLLRVISYFAKKQVTHFNTVYIHDKTQVFLSSLDSPHEEIGPQGVPWVQTYRNLQTVFNSKNWGAQVLQLKEKLRREGVVVPEQWSTYRIEQVSSNQNISSDFIDQHRILSEPLFKILKHINTQSNNYISDRLFQVLGGEKEFQKFQKNKLQLGLDHLRIRTGSGLAFVEEGIRWDNKGTCYSVLKVLKYLELKSHAYRMNLKDFLLNPSAEKGTFRRSDEVSIPFKNQFVVKTGRLFEVPALNLATIIKNKEGNFVYSVFLGHHFENGNEKIILNKRDRMLLDFLNFWQAQDTYF